MTLPLEPKEQLVRVLDLMHRGLVTCPPETTLGEAAALLVRERIHAVVVPGEDGAPPGVLSDTDLLSGEWLSTDAEGLAEMRTITAGELQTTPAATIDAAAPAAEAARRLREEHLSRLVVVEDGAPVGVVSVSDLVRSLAAGSTGRADVRAAMSHAFVACLPETPVRGLARAMTERRSRSVVVLDRSGRAVGIVTGHDLLALVERGDEGATAADLMHEPLTISPGATLAEAADRMLEHEVHRLLVVDADGCALGVISTWDVLAGMAEPGSVWR